MRVQRNIPHPVAVTRIGLPGSSKADRSAAAAHGSTRLGDWSPAHQHLVFLLNSNGPHEPVQGEIVVLATL
jgi:hypothetical protein